MTLRDTPTTRVKLEDGPAVQIELKDVLIPKPEEDTDDDETTGPPPPAAP